VPTGKRILAIALALFTGVLFVGPLPAHAQDRIPVKADLVRPLDASRIKVGDSILAKVATKWISPQCTLRQGAILTGRIVAQTAHSKTDKTSQIALLFESGQCDGRDMKPLPLSVVAVLSVDPILAASSYGNQPLSEATGLGIGGSGGGGAGVGVGGGGGSLRSVTTAAAISYNSPSKYTGPTSVLPGQVIGVRGMKLNVGSGPEGSSILSASGHDVRLEINAQFLLVPNPSAAAPVVAAAAAKTVAASVPPPATASAGSASATTTPDVTDAPDDTEICVPPRCNDALAPPESEIKPTSAEATLSVKDLGYTPVRRDHEMYSFDYGSAISYLGTKELLFTFNPHTLVPRTGTESEFAKLRIIRAVLISVPDKRIEKTINWKVPDDRQYLWRVASDRVLIHVGRELRLYGPGLKEEQKLPLSGPLAFVSASPSAKYFAVGVIQERHSETVHRQLKDAEEVDPEEDVEIKVLDSNLHPLATVMRSSRSAPPVLSDNGEIRIVSAGKNRWQIIEETWESQRHLLTQINSACRPETTTLPPELLFVVGCSRQTAGKWYRVLRPDGKPVLRGTSPVAEFEQTAAGVATANAFTIGMAEAAKSIVSDSAFHASDLASERIAVYRAENGGRVFALTITSPVPTVQTFVLSPDGSQLAVMSGEQIAFYEVPTGNAHR
jgi:hypothetical protein